MTLHESLKALSAALDEFDKALAGEGRDLVTAEAEAEIVIEAARKAVAAYQLLRDGSALPDLWIFARADFQFHRNGGDLTAWRKRLASGWEILITDPTGDRCELAEGESWKVTAYHEALDPAECVAMQTASNDPKEALKHAADLIAKVEALSLLPKVRASQ